MTSSPLPQGLMDELLTLVRVSFHPNGLLSSFSMPSSNELMRMLPVVGGNHVANSVDDILTQLERAAWAALPKWREARLKRGTNAATPPRTETGPPSEATLEAQVRMMPFAQLVDLCDRHDVAFQREAPNQGVLVMRARNAAYQAIRTGRIKSV